MTVLTVIPKNDEVIPSLKNFLSNKKDWVEEVIVYEHIPNEETLEAIREVERGETECIGTIEDFIKWAESV